MVGRDLESFYTRDYCDMKKAEVALKVEELTQEGVFDGISFQVHKGEILGFAGLVGAGRSEIMESIFGARGYTSGTVYLHGKKYVLKILCRQLKRVSLLCRRTGKNKGWYWGIVSRLI